MSCGKNATTLATTPGFVTLHRYQESVILNQMLWDGLGTSNEVDRRKSISDSSAHRLYSTSEEIALQTIEAYLDVLKNTEFVRYAKENLAAHQKTFDQVKLRSDRGVGRRADLEQIDARLALASANLASAESTLRDAEMFGLKPCENIAVIRFDGSLYFANTSYFEDRVQERIATKPDLKYVIVIGEGINQIDATGEEMLSHLAERLDKAGIQLLFTGLKKQVLDVFMRTGLYERLGSERFFRTEDQALDHAWKALGNNHEVDCPLNIVCPVTPQK